MLIDD